MATQPIEHIDLTNGLSVQIYDQSRRTAGDRWYISLVARLDVPIPSGAIALKNGDTVSGAEFQEALGDTIQFEFKTERHFIHEEEKDACFNDMKTSFFKNTKSYLEHPDFQRSFILKKYREHLAQKGLYR